MADTHAATATTTEEHKSPNYFAVFVALAIITALMTAVEVFHIPITTFLKNTIFLVLSLIKAVLVAMFYMHLISDSFLYTVLFLLPVLLVMVLVVILLI